MILTIHSVVCMSPVLGRVLHSGEIELSKLLKQVEMFRQGGILCYRSALHSTDKAGIELAAVLGGSRASIVDTPWRLQLVRVDRFVLCTIHCCWNRYADSGPRTFRQDIAEEFVVKGSGQGRARRGEGC
jgi:hypothetical protein